MGEKTNSYHITFTVDNFTQYQSRELEGWLRNFHWVRDPKVEKVNSVAEHLRNTLWGPKKVRAHERREHATPEAPKPAAPAPQPKQVQPVKQQTKQKPGTKYEYIDGQVVQDNRKFR